MPRLLLAQVRQRGLNDPERTEHVGLQLIAQLLLGQLLDRTELGVPGVVHDDVEPAEVLPGPLDGLDDGGLVGHLQLQREHGVTVGADQVIEVLDVAGGGGHLVAARQGGFDEVAPEAARRTGDEPNLCS